MSTKNYDEIAISPYYSDNGIFDYKRLLTSKDIEELCNLGKDSIYLYNLPETYKFDIFGASPLDIAGFILYLVNNIGYTEIFDILDESESSNDIEILRKWLQNRQSMRLFVEILSKYIILPATISIVNDDSGEYILFEQHLPISADDKIKLDHLQPSIRFASYGFSDGNDTTVIFKRDESDLSYIMKEIARYYGVTYNETCRMVTL